MGQCEDIEIPFPVVSAVSSDYSKGHPQTIIFRIQFISIFH